ASHGSVRIPSGDSSGLLMTAFAIRWAAASRFRSPVALNNSASPPRTTPWLYVQVVPPLLAQLPLCVRRPSLIRFALLRMPLLSNQCHASRARSRYKVSPGILLCSDASSLKYSSLLIAFL